jgi:hypothetical protein
MRTLILGLAALTMAVPALTAAVAGKNEQRDEDGRTYCRRRDGTAGLVMGAAAGALVGRAIESHGNRGTGTIVGGALGALVGREVARNRCQ